MIENHSDHLKTTNLSADNFKKILDLDELTPEPAIPSSDTGQRISCFNSCQLKGLSLIVRVNVVLNRTVVVDSD